MVELKAPVYPEEYFQFGGGARISDSEINRWLNEAFETVREEILQNPDRKKGFSYIASGDTKVSVYYYKDMGTGKYQVSFDVCRSYANADIFDFDPTIPVGFIPVK